MKAFFGVIFLFLLISLACSSSTPSPIPPVNESVTQPEKPSQTSVPVSSDTPAPTNTPSPTDTPAPTLPPTETPAPIIYTGSGDSIVDVVKPYDAALVHITGNASSRYFGISSLDSNNEVIDLLVNTTDPYDGVRPLDLMANQVTTRFEIQADGPWAIEISPISSVYKLMIPGELSGKGDYVFAIAEGTPDTAVITGNADSRYFGVFGYSNGPDMLVNTTDPYNGTVILDKATFLIVVQAVGDWTINITTK